MLPVETAPDWTEDLRGELFVFLRGAAGQALIARLRGTAFLNFKVAGGIECGMVTPDPKVSAGERVSRAAGYFECLQHIESLSRSSIRDNKTDQTMTLAGEGEPELSESFTP